MKQFLWLLAAAYGAYGQTTTSVASLSLSSAASLPSTTVTSELMSSASASLTTTGPTATGVPNSTPSSVPQNVSVGLLTTPVTSANSTLDTFNLTTGGFTNTFFRTNVSSAQILLTAANETGSSLSRFVIATAQGNSGALVYFTAPNGTASNVSLTMDQSTLVSTAGDYNQTGTSGVLTLTGEAQLGVAIVGAVRAMRDYVEGNGLMHEIFNYTVGPSSNSSYLELNRFPINGTRMYQLAMVAESGSFNITPSNNGTYTPPTVIFSPSSNSTMANSTMTNTTMTNSTATGGNTMSIRFTYSTNETAVPGLDASDLFLSSVPTANATANATTNATYISTDALSSALEGLADGNNTNGNDVSFLTYQTKFTAGGWRFLTYFGRDSLISLQILMPLLQPTAIETALGAALERLNSTGTVCHEETIGDYASFININNNQSQLGDTPFYDYKMIDTDYYPVLAMEHYFLETPQGAGRSQDFFAKTATLQNGTYGELTLRNVDLIMNITAPFAQNATWENLISLRPGEPVGNWRDSNQGLGYGQYPLDVNTALVPSALRAIARLSAAGVFPSSYEQNATAYAQVWEQQAPPLFTVSVPADVAQQRLQGFVQAANLSTALLTNSSMTNTTSAMNTTSATNTTTASNITFQALSLSENGTTVQVMNSDPSFALFYGTNLTESFMQEVVQILQPYPQGLLTNVGMLVANPAYDSNTTNYATFDNTHYHGEVVWSFQQALMAGGLAKQLWYCDNSTVVLDYVTQPAQPPAWCNNTQLVASLKQAQAALWQSIEGAKSLIFSEVWSQTYDNATNSFQVADLASLSPEGTESDAIQLWSYGFLAQYDPTTNSTTSSVDSNSTSSSTSSMMTGTTSMPMTMTSTLPTTAVSASSQTGTAVQSFPVTTATASFGRWRD